MRKKVVESNEFERDLEMQVDWNRIETEVEEYRMNGADEDEMKEAYSRAYETELRRTEK